MDRIDRESYPECVRKAADMLTKMYEEGAVFPSRMRFSNEGEHITDDGTYPAGSFAFFIPDVHGIPHGERGDKFPWDVYADTAVQAHRAQVGDWEDD